ncbi:MAG: exo-alpha-sialidase [Planctomycetes bacterium]|nr:exo-alpha-sialidase [Planctomycetota bacterium]
MNRVMSACFLACFCSVSIFISTAHAWNIETVDDTAWDAGAYCSLAVIDGQPAISYNYDSYNLRHARYNGSSWDYTTADEDTWPVVTSLKALPDGNSAIAYHDHDNDDLKYAWFDGSIWQNTVVESAGTTGNFSSLAIVGGQPAISYFDYSPSPDVLKYARFDGTTWDVCSVTTAITTGSSYTSMVVLPDGNPAIAFCSNTNLIYARYNGTTWIVDTNVASVGSSSGYTSMAVLPDGNPAITYYNSGTKSLKYAFYDGSDWTIQEIYKDVYTDVLSGLYSHLAILPNGQPAVSWYWLYPPMGMGQLQFSWLDNGQWRTIQVDGGYGNNAGLYSSLEVLADNTLGIAYYNTDYGTLKFARSETPMTTVMTNVSYIATAWLERTGETVGINEPVETHEYLGGEGCGYVSSSVSLENPMPGSYVGQISLRGWSCLDRECRLRDEETGECLLWGKCVVWDENTGECLEWVEPEIIEPNDANGKLEAHIELLPSATMPIGSPTCLRVSLALSGDTGASETMYCRVYRNEELAAEFLSDTIRYVDVNVGDIIDVNTYLYVESNGGYYRQVDITLYVGEKIQHAPLPSDICGESSQEPDGSVDFFDLACMADRWLETDCMEPDFCGRTDLNVDLSVNFLDFALLAEDWLVGFVPNPPGWGKFYEQTLDTNPGWTIEGLWAFGQPTGEGDGGIPDPTAGYTGVNVYGYNLAGDYENDLSETHLTSTPIDCNGQFNVRLKFWRWLGVEESAYDHAYIQISNNGTDWVVVWQNDDYVADLTWKRMDIDISAVADNHDEVYLRWTMGSTDGSVTYCGWNIDDIQLWGNP